VRTHGRPHHEQNRRRGRPRSPEADQAILDATIDLLYEEGYASMSMEAVADAAGVGKTTIYRRYRDKADLVTAAIAAMPGMHEMPDTGDTRADLVELLRQVARSKERVQSMRLVGTLWAEEDRNPELVRLFRERVIAPRRKMMLEVLRRGQERGEIRAEVDPGLVTEMMVGAHFARQFNGRPFPRDWARQVVETIWPALAAGAAQR
jgi:AcrR family transcriptional regulator